MNWPKVSVCISTYNHEMYIRNCVASVLAQELEGDVEIIVGNDHSIDGTTQIINELEAKYPGRIRHVCREKNIGACENLKQMVIEAQGEFIAHLDGDDFWGPGKLQAQLNHFYAYPDCVACFTNAWTIEADYRPIGVFNNTLPNEFDLRFLLLKGNFLNHSSLVYYSKYKRCILDCPQFFIDYHVSVNLAMLGHLGYINAPYVTYRHNSSQSMIRNENQKVRALYLNVLSYAFRNNDLNDIYEVVYQDLWARIVKDSIGLKSVRFLAYWFRRLYVEINRKRIKIFVVGFFLGLAKQMLGFFEDFVGL